MSDQDLTPLLLDAFGKRIDDPAALKLTEALGARPFTTATPSNDAVFRVNKRMGIEVAASFSIKNRAYFPPRKENRVWVTWVSHAFISPAYRGSLPADFDWQMNDAALSARFKRYLRGAMQTVCFVLPPPREGLRAELELFDDGTIRYLLLGLEEEKDYVTLYPGSGKVEDSVEDGFFASWCALNGVLREGRLTDEQLETLRQRRITPLEFLSSTLGGLLWESDARRDCAPFCHAYQRSLMRPREATATSDAKKIFGNANHFRQKDEAMTQDTWENYDRIAPLYTQRLQQWRQGEIGTLKI